MFRTNYIRITLPFSALGVAGNALFTFILCFSRHFFEMVRLTRLLSFSNRLLENVIQWTSQCEAIAEIQISGFMAEVSRGPSEPTVDH